jgi:hypothetical protein
MSHWGRLVAYLLANYAFVLILPSIVVSPIQEWIRLFHVLVFPILIKLQAQIIEDIWRKDDSKIVGTNCIDKFYKC